MAISYRDTPSIRLLRALHRATRIVSAIDEGEATRAGYHRSEMDVIFTLGNTDGLRMCDLASRMLTSAPNVTRIVKRLESRGLVARHRAARSDREVLARLTPAGAAVFEDLYPRVCGVVRDWFLDRMDPSQQILLAEQLELLVRTAG